MLRTTPPGEDGLYRPRAAAGELENEAQDSAYGDADRYDLEGDGDDVEFDDKPTNAMFLSMVREAEDQAQLYINQVNRKSWSHTYRAFHQQHFQGSKYTTSDFKNRSRLFIPKTRTAVRKDMAAVAASLFGSVDSVNCMPGNEGDNQQRASAALVQELVNYRTDRSTGKASIPWFHVAMGARQTSVLTGICLSKQSWKLELRRKGSEEIDDDENPGKKMKRDVWVPDIDRPDSQLIPPECFVIDPAADWTNPVQDAAYVIIKWPMRLDEIRRKQKDPRRPWKALPESKLRSSGKDTKFDMSAIRRAREQGLDRFDETQTGPNFDVIWIYETFIRTAGEDWTFLSVGDQDMLTDPEPVRDVYPEQFGERPLVMGYGSLEAFRIFPMSNAESWQQLQMETNDLRNLALDATKQNVLPVTKVVRGKQVDLDQLKRRSPGSAIMVQAATDVTWEHPPDIPGSVQAMKQALDIDFDDLSGQQNYGTVNDNNNLGKTLGGLKLAAGAANSVQEFDIRIWIETWTEKVLAQIARLIQFYESDATILGICGDRAGLLEKYGVDQITNELIENEVSIRVNVGLGAGDPQQRLAKFQSAVQVALPLLQLSPEFKNGSMTMDAESVMAEVFGAAGYRDGGKRFIKMGQPSGPPPGADATVDKLKSEAEKNRATAKAAIVTALANAAKVGLGQKELEDAYVDAQFQRDVAHRDQVGRALDMGFQHGHAMRQANQPQQQIGPDGQPMAPDQGAAPDAGGGGGDGITPQPSGPGAGNAGVQAADVGKHGVPAGDAGQQQQADAASLEQNIEKAAAPRGRRLVHHRGADGKISHSDVFDL